MGQTDPILQMHETLLDDDALLQASNPWREAEQNRARKVPERENPLADCLDAAQTFSHPERTGTHTTSIDPSVFSERQPAPTALAPSLPPERIQRILEPASPCSCRGKRTHLCEEAYFT